MLGKSAKTKDPNEPVIVKKYANRRLYNTETSSYVTLEDLAVLVRAERDFVVFDAKSGEDLTHSVLTQIIVEQESRPGGNPMLPIPFLRQLIRFYGKSIEHMVPSYLQVSLDALAREQDRFKQQFSNTFTGSPFEAYQEQARKNVELFTNAMAVFAPFGNQTTGGDPAQNSQPNAAGSAAGSGPAGTTGGATAADAAATGGNATGAAAASHKGAAGGSTSNKAGQSALSTAKSAAQAAGASAGTDPSSAASAGGDGGNSAEDLAAMKQQLAQMQKMFDKLSKDQK